MVRNIAGLLIRIGSGDAEVPWAREVLEARDRRPGRRHGAGRRALPDEG